MQTCLALCLMCVHTYICVTSCHTVTANSIGMKQAHCTCVQIMLYVPSSPSPSNWCTAVVPQIRSLLPDDTPAASRKFRLSVTANNGDIRIKNKPNRVLTTNKMGEWANTFKIPSGANCLKIVVCMWW